MHDLSPSSALAPCRVGPALVAGSTRREAARLTYERRPHDPSRRRSSHPRRPSLVLDRPCRAAFTLLELLAVIAVIGVLASLVFPSISAARKSANRAKTKVQFSQWAAAIESFRSEYGHYPSFDSTNLVNGGATTVISGDHLFHDILAGKKRDGSAPSTASTSSAGYQNRKRITFYSFSDADLTPADSVYPHLIRDAFDNLSIAVLVDRNLDGKIDGSDYGMFPDVMTADGASIRPTATDIPATGVRAGVVFYAPDPNATAADPTLIFSWK
jgi:prepilin-type N-terminal cleavage/methylation domain-containing protein